MVCLARLFFLLITWLALLAHAQALPIPVKDNYPVGAANVECVIAAAQAHAVPANVLLAIASVENGKNGQYVTNTNRSQDIGHFQINSMHWKPGGFFYGQKDFSAEDAAWRGCFNAALAAWILRKNLDTDERVDYWIRAAGYHSRTAHFNQRYRVQLVNYSIQWGNWLEQKYDTAQVSYK